MVDRWWVSLELWVILALVSLAVWFRWWVFFWHRSSGLWCGDCYLTWWKLVWSYGGRGKSVWSYVCGSVVGTDWSSLVVFFFFFFLHGFAFGLMI